MNEIGDLRRVECAECGDGFEIVLRCGFYDLPSDKCPGCGTQYGNADEGLAYAEARLDLEQAKEIARRYSFEQVLEIATRAHAEPANASAEELDALAAFTLLRHAGIDGDYLQDRGH